MQAKPSASQSNYPEGRPISPPGNRRGCDDMGAVPIHPHLHLSSVPLSDRLPGVRKLFFPGQSLLHFPVTLHQTEKGEEQV